MEQPQGRDIIIGVLALQGAFEEHQRCIEKSTGCKTRQVKIICFQRYTIYRLTSFTCIYTLHICFLFFKLLVNIDSYTTRFRKY